MNQEIYKALETKLKAVFDRDELGQMCVGIYLHCLDSQNEIVGVITDSALQYLKMHTNILWIDAAVQDMLFGDAAKPGQFLSIVRHSKTNQCIELHNGSKIYGIKSALSCRGMTFNGVFVHKHNVHSIDDLDEGMRHALLPSLHSIGGFLKFV